jgi:threonine aldolase
MIKRGVGFYEWDLPGQNMYRFVTSWATTEDDLGKLENLMKEIAWEGFSPVSEMARENP